MTLKKFHEREYAACELFFVTRRRCLCRGRHVERLSRHPGRRPFRRRVAAGAFRSTSCRAGCRSLADRMVRAAARSDLAGSIRLIILIDAHTARTSSSAIRQLRETGASLEGLVPRAVQQHIEQHGLYSSITPGAGATARVARRHRQAGCMAKVTSGRTTSVCPRRSSSRSAPRTTRRRSISRVLDLRKAAGLHRLLRHLLRHQPAAGPRHRRRGDRRPWRRPARSPRTSKATTGPNGSSLDYFDFIVHVFAPETRMFLRT